MHQRLRATASINNNKSSQSNLGRAHCSRTATEQSPHWLQWDAPNSPPKLPISLWWSPPHDLHLIHLSLDRLHSPPKMASRSIQLFCHSTLSGHKTDNLKKHSYHSHLNSSQLTLFHLNWVAVIVLWSDPVCRGCDQPEQRRWCCPVWLAAATMNCVASQCTHCHSFQMKWGQMKWGQLRWGQMLWDELYEHSFAHSQ